MRDSMLHYSQRCTAYPGTVGPASITARV